MAALLAEHRSAMLGTAQRCGLSRDDAEDAVQVVALKLVRWRWREEPCGYVLQMLVRQIASRALRSGRRVQVFPSDGDEAVEQDGYHDALETLRAALALLPADDAAVLEALGRGATQREAVPGVSKATAHRRVAAARAALKRELEAGRSAG